MRVAEKHCFQNASIFPEQFVLFSLTINIQISAFYSRYIFYIEFCYKRNQILKFHIKIYLFILTKKYASKKLTTYKDEFSTEFSNFWRKIITIKNNK